MSYQGPLKIRIEMEWSPEGITRFRGGAGPTVKLPKYKYVLIDTPLSYVFCKDEYDAAIRAKQKPMKKDK